MRSYCTVYVDAGYLLASAATRVTGTSLRSGVTINYRELVDEIIGQAEADSGLPLLRVNWYDSAAARGIPDAVQDAIGMLPRTKLRLGRMSRSGEQKGVDLRIGLDLVTHGRNHVADVVYLVSGDDDLTEAVEEAQGHGVQVIIMAAPSAQGLAYAVSRNLQREADGLIVIDPVTIDRTVKQSTRPPLEPAPLGQPAPAPAPAPVPVSAPVVEAAVGPAIEIPAAPTPSMMPSRATSIRPRESAGAARIQPATPPPVVYSSTTGGETRNTLELPPEVESAVDEVARGVVETWRRTATADEVRRVRSERPYIPRELDRTLLVDLSNRLGVYDIDERQRFVLRQRFWDVVEADA